VYSVAFAAAGALLTAMSGAEAAFVIGAWVFAWMVGFVIYMIVQVPQVSSQTRDLFVQTWCENNGMTPLTDAVVPADAPGSRNRETGELTPVIEVMDGELNGYRTTIYQFGISTSEGTSKELVADTLYRVRAVRVVGPPLPVSRLYMHPRWLAGMRFEAGFPPEFKRDDPISTESTAFNQKYVVTMENTSAQIWARRILDPHTINQIVNGGIVLPEMAWYNNSWWFVDRDHLTLGDLATYQDRHRNAVAAMEMMARVQSL
jgi:hypothetical protein